MGTGAGLADAAGLLDALGDGLAGAGADGFGDGLGELEGDGLAVSLAVSPVGESVPGALLPAEKVCVPPYR